MNATQKLHDAGQSLWLDNITRDLLTTGTLKGYIDKLAVTGLTSNPSIFNQAIKGSASYDESMRTKAKAGRKGEDLFFDVAMEDITAAADLFRPIYDRTAGVDGFVSLEVSPLLVRDTAQTIKVAKELHATANRPNLFIKIPGTPEGIPAIEEAIFSGIPVNVTLLFATADFVAAAEAYMRGIERRIEAGLSADVASVASLFISRWDVAVAKEVPAELSNKLGLAVGMQSYKAYCDIIASPRMMRIMNVGGRPQRLLFASTGVKDPKAKDTLYVEGLAAPLTVDTMPEGTLKAFADHGTMGTVITADGGDCEAVLESFRKAGVDLDKLAKKLQDEGAESFVKSWHELLEVVEKKSQSLEKV